MLHRNPGFKFLFLNPHRIGNIPPLVIIQRDIFYPLIPGLDVYQARGWIRENGDVMFGVKFAGAGH